MYLQGALKNYLAEGWALPITHTRKQLAECQKRLGQIEKYPLSQVHSWNRIIAVCPYSSRAHSRMSVGAWIIGEGSLP